MKFELIAKSPLGIDMPVANRYPSVASAKSAAVYLGLSDYDVWQLDRHGTRVVCRDRVRGFASIHVDKSARCA
jgi:hypothetical protein